LPGTFAALNLCLQQWRTVADCSCYGYWCLTRWMMPSGSYIHSLEIEMNIRCWCLCR